MTEQASGSLARVLSPFEVVLLTLSALSPVLSVFIGGNAVLHMAGTGAALAFLLGGLFNACFCLLYAEIGAAFPADREESRTNPSMNRCTSSSLVSAEAMNRLGT